MSTHALLAPPAEENLELGDAAGRASRAGWILFAVGIAGALIAALWQAERFWASYLIAFSYLLSITLGGLFFVIIQHLVRAGWSVTVRRVAEGIASNFLLLAVLAVPVVAGSYMGKLMPKAAAHHEAHAAGHGEADAHGAADAEHTAAALGDFAHGPAIPDVAHGEMDAAKEVWLSFPWVAARLAVFFVLWILIARFYAGTSIKQDESGDPALTARMQRWSAPSVILFALSASLVGFDLLMALDPYWFSTIFGVYFFAGGFLSFFAALIMTLYLLQRSGRVTHSVTPEHYHDVGKFMFAFVVFWAYIAYSQYMLIWYANIPEETIWYWVRQQGAWAAVSVFLILAHFALPFLLLISRYPKRRPSMLALGAAYVLLVHFVDLFWVVAPQKSPLGHFPAPVMDLALLVALGGLYVVSTTRNLARGKLIPIKDPRLVEALNHQNY